MNMRVIIEGLSPISIILPNFYLDSVVKDFSLDVEFLDNLLNQGPSSKIYTVLKDQLLTPPSKTNIREPGQNGAGAPPVLPEFYPAYTAF